MEKSSFFNAELRGEEYDRVYLAEDYARYFASFIGNGVFPTPSTNLQLVATDTMDITLKLGKAWINGYFYENTEDLILSISVAEGVLNRIDRVVLRLDFINREIKVYVKKGTFASTPVAPSLTINSDMYELGIADIKVNKGVTKIVQADITDLRQNNSYCGLVSGVVQQIDTTNLFTQFQSSFDIWFEAIKGQLSTDPAGNLQNQVNTLKNDKINVIDIVNNLTLGGDQKVLSAEQGKTLKTLIDGNTNEAGLGVSGWFKDKKTGFMIQWCEIDANLTASQAIEVAVTMPLGFNAGGAIGWANCISNVLNARYINTNVTVVNSLLGTGIARVYAIQPVNVTMKIKVFMMGW